MQAGVRRAERGPAQVAVIAQAGGGILGLGQQLVGSAAIVVLGGCYRAAQQEGAVDRHRLGAMFGHIPVELGRQTTRRIRCGLAVLAVHHLIAQGPLAHPLP